MKTGSRFVVLLVTALSAASAIALAGCGQQKTAIGGGNPFTFDMDVSPETGRVGEVFVYDINIDILRQGSTLEDVVVQLNIPSTLHLVQALGLGATLNGDPVAIRSQEDHGDHVTYFFGPGNVSEDPSTFEFRCIGVEVANNQFVFATLSAAGTTAPTVSRQVDIEP